MKRWAAIALCACSSSLQTSAVRDTRQSVQIEGLRVEHDDHESLQDTIEVVDVGRAVSVETWSEPAPDGGTPIVHRRVTRSAPVHRDTRTEARAEEHAEAATSVSIDAGTVTHEEEHKVQTSRPSLGFQLWLVLVPAGLIAIGLAVWKLWR